MKRTVPAVVLKAPVHSLTLVPGDSKVEFYVKEDEFMLARYPQQCSLEFSMPVWDDRAILCIALLIRLAGRNAGTFERWINAANSVDLRVLQLLAAQKTLNLYLVSDRVLRSFRQRNGLAGKAGGLVATLRVRPSWTDEQYEQRRRRLDALYPTSEKLWRGAREMEK